MLKYDLRLAIPPRHTELSSPDNNPLATTVGPPRAKPKISIAILAPRRPPASGQFSFNSLPGARSNLPTSIQEEPTSARSDAGSMINGLGPIAPGFGDGNPSLAAMPVKGSKKEQKLKPKNNIVKSNSSYVSRVVPHEYIVRRLQDRSLDGMFAFVNFNRAFMWLDLSSDNKAENLTTVFLKKAHCLCHDVNPVTKSATHLDVIMGFNTGDIIWYEPMSQKYARLNKNGIINPTAVQSIAWISGKENYFLAAFTDGTIIAFDKDKDDAAFTPEFHHQTEPSESSGTEENPNPGILQHHAFRILKSIRSHDQKSNPLAVWKSSHLQINALSFSPNGSYLAMVSADGTLTILDHVTERVLDVYRSYYGAMLCVAWSPDGRYVITGGQDDLVSIWSLAEQALVARCVGHGSWVTDVRFDPWRCDERNYRFGSVGEDCRLLLWDFSVSMLRRPHHGSHGSVSVPTRRESVAVTGRRRTNSTRSTIPPQMDGGTPDADGGRQEQEEDDTVVEVVHAVDSKATTAVLPPVLSKIADPHPMSWLGFEEGCILTSCQDGTLRSLPVPWCPQLVTPTDHDASL